jgi:hypothetical protein
MAATTIDTPIAAQLQRLAAEIIEASEALNNNDTDWAVRYKAKHAAQQIVALTQKPDELWFDQSICMSEFSCIRMFMEWKAFDAIPDEGSISYKELAEKVKVQEALLSMLLLI